MMGSMLSWLHDILHLILWDSAMKQHSRKGKSVVANEKNVNSLRPELQRSVTKAVTCMWQFFFHLVYIFVFLSNAILEFCKEV